MLERDIVNSIMKYLKTVPLCWAYKAHGGMYQQAGIPDIICCLDGKFIAFEVKRPDVGKLSKLQEMTLEKMCAARAYAVVVTSVDEVKEIIQILQEEKS